LLYTNIIKLNEFSKRAIYEPGPNGRKQRRS
jgi:hypothetical protein